MNNNISSIEISKKINMEHRSVFNLINKHFQQFCEFGTIERKIQKQGKKGGRPCDYFIINDIHRIFLIMLLKNSEDGLSLKINELKNFRRKELL